MRSTQSAVVHAEATKTSEVDLPALEEETEIIEGTEEIGVVKGIKIKTNPHPLHGGPQPVMLTYHQQ